MWKRGCMISTDLLMPWLSKCTGAGEKSTAHSSMAPFKKMKSILPDDTIIEVLARLPVKSLYRFKCVSKWWRDTICSSLLIKLHLDRVKQRASSHFLALVCPSALISFPLIRLGQPVCQLELPPLRIFSKHRIIPVESAYEVEGSCHGIVCLSGPNHILLCNPATHSCIKIAVPSREKRGFEYLSSTYVVGHARRSNDYKVIRLVKLLTGRETDIYDTEVHIYSLKKKEWKQGNEMLSSDICSFRGKFVENDAAYFLIRPCNEGKMKVIRYDLDEETSSEIAIPDIGHVNLHLEIIEDKLALIAINFPQFKIWVLNKDASDLRPWTKMSAFQRTKACKGHSGWDLCPCAYYDGKLFFRKEDVGFCCWLDFEEETFIKGRKLYHYKGQAVAYMSTLTPLG